MKDFLFRLRNTLFMVVLAFLPLWIYLGAEAFRDEESLWQVLLLRGIGTVVLGLIQAVFAWALCLLVVLIWHSPLERVG